MLDALMNDVNALESAMNEEQIDREILLTEEFDDIGFFVKEPTFLSNDDSDLEDDSVNENEDINPDSADDDLDGMQGEDPDSSLDENDDGDEEELIEDEDFDDMGL